ncbi:MAG: Asp23/Gls24 family envelope stress response protein [Streptococcaceae bacterium]|nr:Asp23/Gls24 family envelope stress response protein [Streptococcaceae bacterium]MCL2681516.1 Asp23/Gls24 family envelope stress response protein [Streptococcaceae bacterium]MCL2858569.1 Asp23/Gls24 family envelope stress response protein [Streptococcaceae bacterium]
MNVTINTQHGNVDISSDVIATVVGASTTEIFGVVGMTSQNAVKDNFRNILGQDNFSKGVIVSTHDDEIIIDLFVVISYGVKISEVARNIQERVHFNLKNQLGISQAKINVNVQNVKVVED